MDEEKGDYGYADIYDEKNNSLFEFTKSFAWNSKPKLIPVPTTLLSSTPILPSQNYVQVVNKERRTILIILFLTIITGPLIFRYIMGSRISADDDEIGTWGGSLDAFEYFVLIVLYIGMLSSIFRMLPIICGRPAALEASQNCNLEGTCAVGTCSPFVAEDDIILLRSLIGRTSTVFHTAGSRHEIEGLYLDTILNERRLKGEAGRKHLWIQWMIFITKVAKICIKRNRPLREAQNDHQDSQHEGEKESHKKVESDNERKKGKKLSAIAEGDNEDEEVEEKNCVRNEVRAEPRRTRRVTFKDISNFTNFTSTLPEEPESTQGEKKDINDSTPTDNGEREQYSPFNMPSELENMTLELSDIEPLVSFLDGWLEEIKLNEWAYNYDNKLEGFENLFFAAPFMHFFEGQDMIAVHEAIDELYASFSRGGVPDDKDPKRPVYPDDVVEVQWNIRREGYPNWTVIWSLASRTRLRAMTREAANDLEGPPPVYESTRIKPGAIVQCKVYKPPAAFAVDAFFKARKTLYKVVRIENMKKGPAAYLTKFPPDNDVTLVGPYPVAQLELIEKNRGKTGSLNFFNNYLRARAFQWANEIGFNRPVQTFTGIVDARHALMEPNIFWNDALPYFSLVKDTLQPSKKMGRSNMYPVCITVQYPQYFSNVGDDDYLDNTNGAYYNLWQIIRDCAKCITSSGSNTVWEISSPEFEFCTTSRSEDLGTSHKYIEHSVSVYIACFVAYGIAKKTEDYLEALYRWAAGPLELFWPSFFQWEILRHYIKVAIPVAFMTMASFAQNGWWYFIYLFIVLLGILKGLYDKLMGRKALRDFVVSTVISSNLFGFLSNLLSVCWFIGMPARIAFTGSLPFGETFQRSLFWAFTSIVMSFGTALFYDCLIRIARATSKHSNEVNLYMCLYRVTQLYACSFAYSVLSTIAGSYSAFKAWHYDMDLSMWTSFRVSNSEFDKITGAMKGVSVFSLAYWSHVKDYILLYIKSILAGLTMPTTMTKWYTSLAFVLQLACMLTSTVYVNTDNAWAKLVVLANCSLNILMLIDVTVLLQPKLKNLLGYPIRSEYVFGYLGIIIIVSGMVNKALTINDIADRLHIPALR